MVLGPWFWHVKQRAENLTKKSQQAPEPASNPPLDLFLKRENLRDFVASSKWISLAAGQERDTADTASGGVGLESTPEN